MPHDKQIIEAGRTFLVGQGYETMLSEPPVGGGESPDWLAWRRPDEGPYETATMECKRTIEDARRENHKPHNIRYRAGNKRWILVPWELHDKHASELRRICGEHWMGLLIWLTWQENGGIEQVIPAPHHPSVDRRTEDRILHDHIRRIEHRLKELDGPAPSRNGSASRFSLKPYYIDFIHHLLIEHGELAEREVARRLHKRDPEAVGSVDKAMVMIRTALDGPGIAGVQVIESGLDKYLALRNGEPQEQREGK